MFLKAFICFDVHPGRAEDVDGSEAHDPAAAGDGEEYRRLPSDERYSGTDR